MLVVMTATFAIGAPITMVVGVVMAIRQDVGLSTILLVAVPTAGVVLGSVVYRMIPAFQVMQERIDQINRVLREQITGIRVVRAFVREPLEKERFDEANTGLTAVSLRTGRLMSSMFPLVNLLINVSSVAVLWVGADRVASGDLQVGSLVAYLSYLVQVLFSVMMATFMVSMIPRASVSSERIQEVLDTDSSVARPHEPRPRAAGQGRAGAHRRRLLLSGRGAAGARRHLVHHPTRPHHRHRGQHRRRQDHAHQPGAPPLRRHGGLGAGRRRRRARARSRRALADDGPRAAEAVPLLGHRGVQPPVREAGCHRGGDVGGPRGGAGGRLRAGHAGRPRGPHRAGGTNVSGGQRQRLSIARALVRKPDIYLFDDSFSALDLATDARLRAALVPYTRDAAVVIVAQRVSTIATADEIVVLDDGRIVGIGTHDDLLATCPTYAEIVESQIGADAA